MLAMDWVKRHETVAGGGEVIAGMWATPPGAPSKLKKDHQVETKLGKGYGTTR